jgi:hypothetical protein
MRFRVVMYSTIAVVESIHETQLQGEARDTLPRLQAKSERTTNYVSGD